MIPFKIKLLTETAKAPTQENEGDLWDLYADDFDVSMWKDLKHKTVYKIGDFTVFQRKTRNNDIPKTYQKVTLNPQGRILVKIGIAIELPKQYDGRVRDGQEFWEYQELNHLPILSYAVADIRPRSGLALKHGITVLNTPGTIDNKYRKEIGVILYNAGHEPYTITKRDKIAQMLIRPLYPSKMEIVENIEDTQRNGFGSTGK
jgi:dUTP pyrophosphatase